MINNIADRFTEVYSILKCLDEKDTNNNLERNRKKKK